MKHSERNPAPQGRRGLRWQHRVAIVAGVGVLAASTVSATAATRHTPATMTGRAYTLSAELGLLGNPESTLISPVPDTGVVSTNTTSTVTPSCIDIPAGILVAKALCDSVTTHAFTSRIVANSTLADLTVSIPGVPVIELRGVKAWSTITCGSSHGTTTIAFLKIGGKNIISRKTTFSNGLTIAAGPVTIVINTTARTGGVNRARSVEAIHIAVNLPGVAVADVVVGYASASVADCV